MFEPISCFPPSARWDSIAFLFISSIWPAESQTVIEPGNPSTHSCLLTLTKTALPNSRLLPDNRIAACSQGLISLKGSFRRDRFIDVVEKRRFQR